MKLSLISRISVIAFALIASAMATLAQDEPILETYVLGAGQNSDGTAVLVSDKYFGNGTARARLSFFDTSSTFDPEGATGTLALSVYRYVRPGQITFALLCSGVQVRGYDPEGNLVYSRDLPAFTFGDSASGSYYRVLRRIPNRVADLQVTFLGNYE